MSPLTSFTLFPDLPQELQILVWRFSFLNNTSYASQEYKIEIANATNPEYGPLLYGSGPEDLDDWYRNKAEQDTAFWTYHYDPYDQTVWKYTSVIEDPGPWASPQIRLAEGVDDIGIIVGTMVMDFSGIPALLHVCRDSRIVALKCWLEVMLGYWSDGHQPWYHMVGQVRKVLKRMVGQRVMFKTVDGGGKTFHLTNKRPGQD